MRYLVLFFLFFSFSNAHKVNLFISEENGILDIYSYFANGTPCKNCQIIIKDGDKIILDDSLNEEGKYLYTLEVRQIEVVVDAQGGHIAKEKVEVENLKKEDIKEHLKKEKNTEYIKIIIGLTLIFLIFLILKKVKRK